MPGKDLKLADGNGAILTSLTGHAADAIVQAAGEHGVFLAILLLHGNCLDWAIFNTITACLALVNVDGNKKHTASWNKMQSYAGAQPLLET
jgi:hypothetical protein